MYQSTYRRILPTHGCDYLPLNLIYMPSNIFVISHHHIPFFLSNSLLSQISQTWVSQIIHITLVWKVTPCISKDVNLTLKSVLLIALRTKWQYVPSTCSIYQTARRHNPERQELFLQYYFIRYRHIAMYIYTTSRFILSTFLAVTCVRNDLQ